MPRIILKFKEKALKDYPLQAGTPLSIGRQGDNQIVIDNLAVSGHHAKIELLDGRVHLTDLDSKNGTFRNEKAVTSCQLKHADAILIGKHTLIYDANKDAVTQSMSDGAGLAADLEADITMMIDTKKHRSMTGKGSSASEQPTAFLLSLSEGEQKLALSKSITTMGKGPQCDIAVGGLLAFLVGDTAATISRTREHYYISHVGGWIKPKVNNQAVKGSVRLNDMDVVSLGAASYQFALSDPDRG